MTGKLAARGVVACPGKAYRWVEEMVQIGQCFEEDGGWGEQAKVLGRVAEIYDLLGRTVTESGGAEGLGSLEKVVNALREGLNGQKVSGRSLEEDEQGTGKGKGA